MRRKLLLISSIMILACASSGKYAGMEEKKSIFINSSKDKKEVAAKDIAKKFLLIIDEYTNYQYAEYGVAYKNNGFTEKIKKICDKDLSKCEDNWEKYEIKAPLWKVFITSCKTADCMGGYFIVYIDDITGEVVYYGGYK